MPDPEIAGWYVPKGGFLLHAIVKGTGGRALCGHKPSRPTTSLMKPRHGWLRVSNPEQHRECKRCRQRFDKTSGEAT